MNALEVNFLGPAVTVPVTTMPSLRTSLLQGCMAAPGDAWLRRAPLGCGALHPRPPLATLQPHTRLAKSTPITPHTARAFSHTALPHTKAQAISRPRVQGGRCHTCLVLLRRWSHAMPLFLLHLTRLPCLFQARGHEECSSSSLTVKKSFDKGVRNEKVFFHAATKPPLSMHWTPSMPDADITNEMCPTSNTHPSTTCALAAQRHNNASPRHSCARCRGLCVERKHKFLLFTHAVRGTRALV